MSKKAASQSSNGTGGNGASDQQAAGNNAGDAGTNDGQANNQQNQNAAGDEGEDGEITLADLQAQLNAERASRIRVEGELNNIKTAAAAEKAKALKGTDQTAYLATLEAENAQLKADHEATQKTFIESLKMEKLKSEAAKMGLRADSMKAFERLVEPGKLPHFTDEEGRIALPKAETFMKAFKAENPFLFGNAAQMNVNAGGGRAAGGSSAGNGETLTLPQVEAFKGKPEYQDKLKQWLLQQKRARASA